MTPERIRTLSFLWPFVALALGACAVGPPGSEYNLPTPVAASPDRMPPDARAAAATVEEGLRNGNLAGIKGVRVVAGADAALREKGFAFEGFALEGSALLRYTDRDAPAKPGAKDAAKDAGRIISGRLTFKDALGRRAESLYYADYRFIAGGIELTEMRAAPLFSTYPEPIMFVVPAEVAVGRPGGLPKVHSDLLRFAAENAVDWSTPAKTPTGERNYVIFVFLMDRVSPSAEFHVKIATDANATQGYKESSKYLDFNGWRVGVTPGRFALDRVNFFINAVFTPGEEVGFMSRITRLVGVFPMDLTEARKRGGGTAAR